jgi:hypothetical protein
MTLATAEVLGEDIRAGQYVVFGNKAFCVLQNDRAQSRGDGALKLQCNWSNPWRDYECRDTFQVVTRLVNK